MKGAKTVPGRELGKSTPSRENSKCKGPGGSADDTVWCGRAERQCRRGQGERLLDHWTAFGFYSNDHDEYLLHGAVVKLKKKTICVKSLAQ